MRPLGLISTSLDNEYVHTNLQRRTVDACHVICLFAVFSPAGTVSLLFSRVLLCELGTGSQQPAANADNSEDASGPSTYSNAIGLGFGKNKKLQQLWLKQEAAADLRQYISSTPFISNNCEVGT